MSSHFQTIKSYLPWIKSPLIVNGPMAGAAGVQLATAIAKAGGHGQIGSFNDAATLEKQFSELQENFKDDPAFTSSSSSSSSSTTTLPIGVGLLVFGGKLDSLLPVFAKHRPAVIWMFAAPSLDDYGTWARQIRSASPASKIWIQAGSVASALHIAATVSPDVLVMQGADAGGHGYEKGAGIVSLVPETIDKLAASGHAHIPILASGGIVDGRGVATALSLGAAGVVMGTRFLSATETAIDPKYRDAILQSSDGGQTTTRAKLFDELKGPNVWPVEYDGRGIVNASYRDHLAGVDIEQLRKSYAESIKEEHRGFGVGDDGRIVIWAGTGVGLVTKRQSAREIVEEVREGARKALESAMAKL